MSDTNDPTGKSPAARIERELHALLPVALRVSQDVNEDRQATAGRLIRVVMRIVGPHLKEDT